MEKKLEPAELIRPFGPSIIKCKIPDEFIKVINEYNNLFVQNQINYIKNPEKK